MLAENSQGGFSLAEMLMAMLIGSMMIVSVAAMYPALQRQSLTLYRLYRLEQSMEQVLMAIAKDLRRAGFLFKNGNARVSDAIVISQHAQSATGSCLIIRYDLNHNGVIDSVDSATAEHFAYRWLNNSIEQHRSAKDCHGNGWERLFDPAEIVITHFSVQPEGNLRHGSGENAAYYLIMLEGHWKRWPSVKQRLRLRVGEVR
ncbi:prepilin peptidase-dependent protein [Budviciaceae bacterium BWR-B9]|uniref:Prepilin peptidase-dependent protein n=1 Tax=Limnobaculum allomyrinae TaxID=2791986 RepID=A0ABS1IS61_9GAMM|nr:MULTISPECIES: prepilin peptidase-dependent protein [Limnobaculum]MBK5144603.1 prepilin peptidase-dependent protein [Limnobaculum allomyrinae]MBV7692166.1 prepilin peptidase-dependent protein [Limnobaculum sp. M2-1]